jgi:hypothetical protein
LRGESGWDFIEGERWESWVDRKGGKREDEGRYKEKEKKE